MASTCVGCRRERRRRRARQGVPTLGVVHGSHALYVRPAADGVRDEAARARQASGGTLALRTAVLAAVTRARSVGCNPPMMQRCAPAASAKPLFLCFRAPENYSIAPAMAYNQGHMHARMKRKPAVAAQASSAARTPLPPAARRSARQSRFAHCMEPWHRCQHSLVPMYATQFNHMSSCTGRGWAMVSTRRRNTLAAAPAAPPPPKQHMGHRVVCIPPAQVLVSRSGRRAEQVEPRKLLWRTCAHMKASCSRRRSSVCRLNISLQVEGQYLAVKLQWTVPGMACELATLLPGCFTVRANPPRPAGCSSQGHLSNIIKPASPLKAVAAVHPIPVAPGADVVAVGRRAHAAAQP